MKVRLEKTVTITMDQDEAKTLLRILPSNGGSAVPEVTFAGELREAVRAALFED